MKKISALYLVAALFACDLNAQSFLKKLEKAASKSLGENLNENLAAKGDELRIKLDSVDFQYAISLNQGAGFFNIEQKGETGSKLLYSLKEASEKSMVEKARDTLEMGIGMYQIRRYEMAEFTIRKTKEMMEKSSLTDEIVYLRVLSNLGLIYLTQGKTAEAERLIKEALQKSEMALGKNSPAYIANLNNYAKLNQVLGRYNESEKAFGESYSYSEEVFGGGMQQAIILNNQAMLYQTLGQYDRAVDMMKEAINASTKAPKKVFEGEKSFDNRKFKANLATVYQTSGRFEEAEKLFLELKEIFENRRNPLLPNGKK
jgi:tetratricopeptide (TPR) repeat protein